MHQQRVERKTTNLYGTHRTDPIGILGGGMFLCFSIFFLPFVEKKAKEKETRPLSCLESVSLLFFVKQNLFCYRAMTFRRWGGEVALSRRASGDERSHRKKKRDDSFGAVAGPPSSHCRCCPLLLLLSTLKVDRKKKKMQGADGAPAPTGKGNVKEEEKKETVAYV